MGPTKRCSRCGLHKAFYAFYRRTVAHDGLQSYCKPCMRIATRDFDRHNTARRRAENPEYFAAAQRRYNARQNNPVSVSEKKCRLCHFVLPADRFNRNRIIKDGLCQECKDCSRFLVLQRRRLREPPAQPRSFRPSPHFEFFDLAELYDREQGCCHICKKRVSRESFTVDHLTPLSAGGSHTLKNVRIAHRSCNSSRGDREVPLFEGAL